MTAMTKARLEIFRLRLEVDQVAQFRRDHPNAIPDQERRECTVTVKPSRKYTKVDVGTSGKYMVDNDTGEIFGIKAYGVIHRGHRYGTLERTDEWYWGGYVAVPKGQS